MPKEPSQDQTALMWAAAEHHPDVVKLLVDARRRPPGAHEARVQRAAFRGARRRPRVRADPAGRGHGHQYPLPAGTPPSEARHRRQAGSGIRGGGGRDGGPSYEATVSAGSTPLLVATVRAQVPLALFLLEHGADPNASDAGFTPLHWAVGHLGKRRGQSRVRLHRCDERDSRTARRSCSS